MGEHLETRPAAQPKDRAESLVARNGAAHMALVDADQLRIAVIEMVRVVEALLPNMELDRTRFWGPGARSVADSLLNEANDAIQDRFEAKMAAARREVHRLTTSVSNPKTAAALLATLAARTHRTSTGDNIEVEHECPVCRQDGTLFCEVLDVDISGGSGDEYCSGTRQLVAPLAFACRACDLNLNADELPLAELPSCRARLI